MLAATPADMRRMYAHPDLRAAMAASRGLSFTRNVYLRDAQVQ
jgi:hypothetical protein